MVDGVKEMKVHGRLFRETVEEAINFIQKLHPIFFDLRVLAMDGKVTLSRFSIAKDARRGS